MRIWIWIMSKSFRPFQIWYQSPFVSITAPPLIRTFIQGARSLNDQRLIRKILRKRNSKLKYRTFKSINLPELYQIKGIRENVESWFATDHLGLKDEVINLLDNRTKLKAWPLMNTDILMLGATNIFYEKLFEK